MWTIAVRPAHRLTMQVVTKGRSSIICVERMVFKQMTCFDSTHISSSWLRLAGTTPCRSTSTYRQLHFAGLPQPRTLSQIVPRMDCRRLDRRAFGAHPYVPTPQQATGKGWLMGVIQSANLVYLASALLAILIPFIALILKFRREEETQQTMRKNDLKTFR